MSERTRRFTIVGLVILTVALIGAAIYLGVTIQQNQSPSDANASVACCSGGETNLAASNQACTSGGGRVGACACEASSTPSCSSAMILSTCKGDGSGYNFTSCANGCSNNKCNTSPATCTTSNCSGFCSGENGLGTADCANGVIGTYQNGEACCKKAATGGSSSGTTSSGSTSSGSTSSGSTGSSSSSSSSGGGAAPSLSICGGSCSTTSDCATSQFGFQPICQAGKCVNPICPTDYNANPQCACKTNSGKCGDKCGIWSDGFHPLCGAGSTCSWINGPTCGGQNLTYCMPITAHNGYTKGTCTNTADASGYQYLKDPSGAYITTQAQILAACAPDPVCGDGIKNGSEQCDPTGNNTCASGLTCNNSCSCVTPPASCGDGVVNGGEQCDPRAANACGSGNICTGACNCITPTLPNTALISDQADAALLGGLLLVAGLFALRFHAIDKTWLLANDSLKNAYENYFGAESVRRRELDKLKPSRSKFEQELEKKIERKK